MRQTWSGVNGSLVLEVNEDMKAAALLAPYHVGDTELVIEFKSSGYYLPASTYGGSDHLGWAAEGDDERTLTRAFLTDGEDLPRAVQEEVFDLLHEEVDAQELDTEPDEYDRDDYSGYD